MVTPNCHAKRTARPTVGKRLNNDLLQKLQRFLSQMGVDSCNEMGCLATTEALQKFDTDGSPIKLGETKLTARAKDNKTYQTPYGSVQLERYVYQSPKGGRIDCPLEQNARIIRGATPKFAQQIAHKYANMNAPAVCRDLEENHHRKIAHSYLQDVSDWVGGIAQAKEELWE